MLPVPAVDFRGRPALLSLRLAQRGQRAVPQPRPTPVWT
jgi:hypothetical protein